jgi:hypothetical protein
MKLLSLGESHTQIVQDSNQKSDGRDSEPLCALSMLEEHTP